MSKANEPAYPHQRSGGLGTTPGLTKKERLAMEIYVSHLAKRGYDFTDHGLEAEATKSLRAADIFFEQWEKNSKP